MRRTIMYYPNIEIPDGVWLKTALLYWDEVSSIVPRGMERALYLSSKPIAQLAGEGEYRPFYPDELMDSIYYRDFETECISKIKRHINVGSKRRKGNRIISETMTERKRLSDTYNIHIDKMSDRISEVLLNELRVISLDENWMIFDETLGDIYMSTLAKYSALSDVNFTVIGTDKIKEINRLYPLNYALKKQINSGRTPIINLSLNILPTPAPDVPYEKIIQFKRKYKENLIEFRKKINDFEEQISNSESEYDYKEKIIRFNETIQLEAKETMKMLKGHRINFFYPH
ncbi:hypothetical protein CIW83_02780 [Tissierella sp. P1]|uniref:DUF6236 family protein n=1 Tax=Tissierella sp. P1 TaxID=1280483 RepID=UPI000BA03337|nr:DUF6236 family protein [Tissierella sp. P1]OZV13487.1 hypothetical protein CIW83_02780 [Tissierella sp. P1]